jgi:hypothetical protein
LCFGRFGSYDSISGEPFGFTQFNNKESNMNKIGLYFGIVIPVFILLMHVDSFAFRCGKQLVGVGEVKYRVVQLCGEPDYKEVVKSQTQDSNTTTYAGARSQRYRPRWHPRSYTGGGYNEETVLIENWSYDCGSNDFIYVLTFEGDRLIKEDTKGRGSQSGDCSSARNKQGVSGQQGNPQKANHDTQRYNTQPYERKQNCGEPCTGSTLYDVRNCHIKRAMELYAPKNKTIAFDMYRQQCLTDQERELYPVFISKEMEEKLMSTAAPKVMWKSEEIEGTRIIKRTAEDGTPYYTNE